MIDFHAFADELEKIAMEKDAAFLQNLGTGFVRTMRGAAQNVKNTAKAFANPVEGVKAGVSEMKAPGWRGALNVAGTGIGGALMLPGVLKKEDPTGQGASRAARGAAFVGGQIGGLLGAPHGLTGGIAGGIAGEALGRGVGRVIDKARGIKRKPKPNATAPLRSPVVT